MAFTKKDVSNSYISSNPDIPVAQKTIGSGAAAISYQGVILADESGNEFNAGNPLPVTGSVNTTTYTLRYDEGATYTYIGEAIPGVSTASALWRIKRMTNADTTIIWADGDSSLDNIWDNRAVLSYS